MERSSFIETQRSVEVPRRLLDGVDIWKITSNGKRIEAATLRLGPDKFTIYINVKRQRAGFFLRRVSSDQSTHHDANGRKEIGGDKRIIDIGAIDRIQRGQTSIVGRSGRRQSDTVIVVGKGQGSPTKDAPPDKVTPDKSFSIIFRGERQLDLMAQNSMDRDEILDRLDHIIYTYQEAKRKVGTDVLLLRYVWLDADKVSLPSSSARLQ